PGAELALSPHPLPLVTGDESRLGQAFLNLLRNAAEALAADGARGSSIRVSTEVTGDGWVVVEIADTGCGMPPELVKNIFDPFFTSKDIGSGTGLGLAICHGIVTSYGGQITVHSEPGQGSTFRVT